MKKINKKPLVIIGGLFGVIILIIIIVALVRSCGGPGSNYEKTERTMVAAASKYFNQEGNSLPNEFESKEVSAAELASSGAMKPLSEQLKDATCTGSVKVYNQGGQYLYLPILNCTEYKTQLLKDKIISDNMVESTSVSDTEVTDESTSVDGESSSSENQTDNEDNNYTSGLYQVESNYVFRGKNPNNYLSFGGIIWRIIDIDANGLIRAIKNESETRAIYWDTKFNSDASKAYGINDYKNSYILETMNNEYQKFKDENKLHLAPFSVCIGKRDANDLRIDYSVDCAETLENQYIGIIDSSDFSRASLDRNCTKITNGACTNYNYLTNVTGETWTSTGLTRNTYEVIYINGGIAAAMNARRTANYNWVIAFRGEEKYISGDGTISNPYLIGSNAS